MVYNTKQYTIGGIRFQINFLSPIFNFTPKAGSHYFQEQNSDQKAEWVINFDLATHLKKNKWTVLFTGSDQFKEDIPYKWSIIKLGNCTGIFFEFENHSNISTGLALFNEINKTIEISLDLHTSSPMDIDPFFHPLGVHILQYIAYLNKGIIIHASAVSYKNKGYLFSAVSGTGKSTMAALWQKLGATVINDDRLMLMPHNGVYMTYNTPMPYYQDSNKTVKLHKTFLIKQSATNYIKPLAPLQGTLGLLSNCMQYQYDETQIQRRLTALHTIAEHCGVYECGFTPDIEIVKLIQQQFGESED